MTDREIKVYGLSWLKGRFTAKGCAADTNPHIAASLEEHLNNGVPFAVLATDGSAYLIRPWPVQGVPCIDLESIHTFGDGTVVANGWISNGLESERQKSQIHVDEIIKDGARKIVPMKGVSALGKVA